MKYYMARDQYGNTYHGLARPRKDLLERLDATKAEKMYVDGEDGKSYHVGYIIKGHWLAVYEVIPMRKEG